LQTPTSVGIFAQYIGCRALRRDRLPIRPGQLQSPVDDDQGDYRIAPLGIYAVYPGTHHLSAKVRVFIDFLAARFSGGVSWILDSGCAPATLIKQTGYIREKDGYQEAAPRVFPIYRPTGIPYCPHMGTMPQKRLTIRDIATRAGVSTSTVSRVLNNSGYVKAEVRERIEAVISQTHYTPSELAKQLKSQRSGLIGVIIPKINSYTTSEVVAGISATLEPLHYQMLLANTDNLVTQEEAAYDLFRRQRVAGVLHLATTVNDGLINAIREAGLPIVMIGQDASHLGMSSVIQNERSAARQMTEHLLDGGHTRIGLVTVGDEDIQVGGERTAGYVDALQARGLPVDPDLMVRASFRSEAGEEAAELLLRATGAARCTAILAVTDRLAVGVMACLHDHGIRVPDDMAVAGMGDSDMARMVRPALSTVHYDYAGTGAEAARLMLSMRDNKDSKDGKAARAVMPYRLALRRST